MSERGQSGALSRRHFLEVLGAGAAGLGACGRVPEDVLPYVDQPPEVTPGEGTWYATSFALDGWATGLLVESREGRPVKVEGNPAHPASLGATGILEQALTFGLYDGARARRPFGPEGSAEPSAFLAALASRASENGGAGFRFLLEPSSSPLVARAMDRVRDALPGARVHFDSPATMRSGPALTPGFAAQYDFGLADIVVSLDADFLAALPINVRHAHDFMAARDLGGAVTTNRLYVVEAGLSVTGASADHRLPVRDAQITAVAAALLREVLGGTAADAGAPVDARLPADTRAWVGGVARDLLANPGRSLVVAGQRQPAEVHAAARILNDALGNTGATTWYTRSALLMADDDEAGLPALATAMEAGEVTTLVMVGVNPLYTAPADLRFGELLARVDTSFCVDLHATETARNCTWFAPALHVFEMWGDARARDGTLSPVQPLIEPLYGGLDTVDVLLAAAGEPPGDRHDRLRTSWLEGGLVAGEDAWLAALRSGLVADSAFPRESAPPPPTASEVLARLDARPAPDEGLEIAFVTDSRVHDGRYATNAWLQELPDPITKLTWDNAALLSPATAADLGVATEDVVRLSFGGRDLELPVLVVPGHAANSVTLRLGGGRTAGGRVAEGRDFDAYRLRTTDAPWFGSGLRLEPTGATHPLAITQDHASMEGRPIVLSATLAAYRADPDFTAARRGPVPSLYEPWPYEGDQWAMAIDLARCTGCSACVIACQAENNVPVVGKDGIRTGREMHWLRIDRYFAGDPENPRVLVQPMLCQHCEKAPCEYVCPVNATVHSPDGLNEMVYSRCVGTRFCSNNCPYKVRRFNWFDYHAESAGTERLLLNPDVTVRGRGVIEKCTFCVQRIRRAGIRASIEGRTIGADEVVPACAQACPTRAITFGSLANAEGALAERLSEPRRYALLHELGTRPRVTYLAEISHPNPDLSGSGS